MKAHSRSAFTKLAIAYPIWADKFDCTEKIEAWCSYLDGMDPKCLSEAVEHVIKNNRFAPSIAELLCYNDDPTGAKRAQREHEKTLEAMRKEELEWQQELERRKAKETKP